MIIQNIPVQVKHHLKHNRIGLQGRPLNETLTNNFAQSVLKQRHCKYEKMMSRSGIHPSRLGHYYLSSTRVSSTLSRVYGQ